MSPHFLDTLNDFAIYVWLIHFLLVAYVCLDLWTLYLRFLNALVQINELENRLNAMSTSDLLDSIHVQMMEVDEISETLETRLAGYDLALTLSFTDLHSDQ